MRIRVFDTETTGLGHSALACEVGYHDLVGEGKQWVIESQMSAVFNTHAKGVRVESAAFRIHGITPEEIDKGYDYDLRHKFITYKEPDVYAAHNAQFDLKFFSISDKPIICTMKIAKLVWRGAPSFKNGELGIWKGVIQSLDDLHRTEADTRCTAGLLKLMLEEGYSVEGMVQSTNLTVDPNKLGFGKHAGKRVDNPSIPIDYLEFLVDLPNLAETQRTAVRDEIAKRRSYA